MAVGDIESPKSRVLVSPRHVLDKLRVRAGFTAAEIVAIPISVLIWGPCWRRTPWLLAARSQQAGPLTAAVVHSSSWRFSMRTAALSALYCFRLFSQSPSMRRANSLK